MKPIILLVLLISAKVNLFSQSQSPEQKARITDIKRMYQEVNNAQKVHCENDTTYIYDSFDPGDPTIEKSPFPQIAEKCELTNGYSILKGVFTAYESYMEFNYYYYNNQLFFVFISSGGESCLSEDRYYFDINQNIIKYINKSNDCDGFSDKMITKEITSKTELASSKKEIINTHQRILDILNH
jgi:hypothetical protein